MGNIYKLIIARFVSGLYFAIPIQTLFLFEKGLTFAQIMWLESILLIGILIFEVPTGILGDIIGRKWSLVLSAIISLLSWIPWFIADGFILFGFSFFLLGLSHAFFSGSDQALIYDDLKSQGIEDKMKKVYGLFLAAGTSGTAISALLGGWIAIGHTLSEFYSLYTITVLMQFAGLLLLLTVKESPHSHEGTSIEHSPESSWKLMKSGISALRNNERLRRIVLLSIFTTPFSVTLIYIFQPYFKVADVSNEWYGAVLFFSSLFVVSAKLFAYKTEEWFGIEKGLLLVTLLPALFWVLMAIVFHPLISILIFILNDTSGNLRDPLFADYINQHIESHIRATTLSTISLFTSLYILLTRPLVGYLADIDLHFSFLFIASVICIGAIIFRLKPSNLSKG